MYVFDMERMAHHFLAAAVFSSSDADQDLNPVPSACSKVPALRYCSEFAALAQPLLDELLEYPSYWAHPDCGGHVEGAIGHDLWLTATGAGVGFFDRDALPDDLRQALTNVSENLARIGYNYTQEGSTFYLNYSYPQHNGQLPTSGDLICMAHTGTTPVAPGHPIVLAVLGLDLYRGHIQQAIPFLDDFKADFRIKGTPQAKQHAADLIHGLISRNSTPWQVIVLSHLQWMSMMEALDSAEVQSSGDRQARMMRKYFLAICAMHGLF